MTFLLPPGIKGLKFYDLNLKYLRLDNYSLVDTYYCIYKFLDIVSVGNLIERYSLSNGVFQWRHESGHMTFPEVNFWCVTSYLKCQPSHKLWSWSLDVMNLVKKTKTVCSLMITMFVKIVTWPSWRNHWSTYLSKYPQLEFNFVSCREICI